MPQFIADSDIRAINEVGWKMRPINQNLFEVLAACANGHTHSLWIEIAWNGKWCAWRDGTAVLPDGQARFDPRQRQGQFPTFRQAFDAACQCKVDETIAQRCTCETNKYLSHGSPTCTVHPLCEECGLARGQWHGYGLELGLCKCKVVS